MLEPIFKSLLEGPCFELGQADLMCCLSAFEDKLPVGATAVGTARFARDYNGINAGWTPPLWGVATRRCTWNAPMSQVVLDSVLTGQSEKALAELRTAGMTNAVQFEEKRQRLQR